MTTDDDEKFQSADDLLAELEVGNEFEVSYAGEEYAINSSISKDKKERFYISNTRFNETVPGYDTFDEMLDNFKAPDGKSLREFILEATITDEAIAIGELTSKNNT